MGFNVWTFLLQAVNFAVLAYVLQRVLYRPLHKAIDDRRQANERARNEAEKARQEAAALQLQAQTQLATLEKERQDMVRQARAQADKERTDLLADAEKTVQLRRAEFEQALSKDRAEALQALKSEVAGMAVDLARRLMREASGTTLQQQLATRLGETLRQLPDAERAELRAHWQPDDGVVLETAAELDPGSGQEIGHAVAELLGKAVSPAVHLKPELVAGMRLRIGGHLWDASLAGRLNEARNAKPEGAGS